MRAVKNLMMPVMHSVTLRILKYLMFVYTVCIFKTISPTRGAPAQSPHAANVSLSPGRAPRPAGAGSGTDHE